MVMTFVSVAAWSATGDFLEGIVGKTVEGLGEQTIVAGTHGIVGGALSVANDGSFLEGFASAGLGSIGGFAGKGIAGNGPGGFYLRTALATTSGGLAAEITGGKFSNGAITAAFGYLFNDYGHSRQTPLGAGVGGTPTGVGIGLGAALSAFGNAIYN